MLIRNPYDAIISWWNHVKAKDVSGEGLDEDELQKSLMTKEFCDFAIVEVEHWRILHLDWLHLVDDLLIIHFEMMKQSPEMYLKYILNYLNIPLLKNRLNCLKKHPHLKYKRTKKELKQYPICPEVIPMLEKAIKDVNEVLIEKYFEGLPWQLYKPWK